MARRWRLPYLNPHLIRCIVAALSQQQQAWLVAYQTALVGLVRASIDLQASAAIIRRSALRMHVPLGGQSDTLFNEGIAN